MKGKIEHIDVIYDVLGTIGFLNNMENKIISARELI